MKKVLITGAALLLAGGIGLPMAANAADEPGVKITGDARVRYLFTNKAAFGNNDEGSRTDMDSRVRVNVTGTAAGGAYAKARLRLLESGTEDFDRDNLGRNGYGSTGNNVWVDLAYIGVPFNENVTLETGRYRSTYGPSTTSSSANLLYDDVSAGGLRLLVTTGDWAITPFVEWLERGESGTAADVRDDNDAMRYGANFRYTFNDNWAAGALLGYQSDDRSDNGWGVNNDWANDWKQNDGFFASIYVNGKVDNFAITAEFAFTEAEINGFNSWTDDNFSNVASAGNDLLRDRIGSKDNGFGGYIFPNYTINNLNIGLHLGFTANGFIPDYNFGFILTGSEEPIRALSVGEGGDWLWAGLVVNYKVSDNLRLAGNLVYVDVDAWDTWGPGGDGPNGLRSFDYEWGLENAWEVSGSLRYTVSKGLVFSWYAGYLQPEFEADWADDDGYFASYAKFDLSF